MPSLPYPLRQGFFENEKQLVIVLEYMGGGELLAQLKVVKMFCESSAAFIFHQVVEAVAYMHRRGLIHRDIKPENIMLASKMRSSWKRRGNAPGDIEIKLIDFGMALDYRRHPERRVALGTLGFISPEVCHLGPNTPAMDMWSLGVLLHIMVCGTFPYTSRQIEELLYPDIPFRRSPGYTSGGFRSLSPGARDLITRLLEHDPRDRITAEEALRHPWLQQANQGSISRQHVPLRAVDGTKHSAGQCGATALLHCAVEDQEEAAEKGGKIAVDDQRPSRRNLRQSLPWIGLNRTGNRPLYQKHVSSLYGFGVREWTCKNLVLETMRREHQSMSKAQPPGTTAVGVGLFEQKQA